jgi:hypothetical protein
MKGIKETKSSVSGFHLFFPRENPYILSTPIWHRTHETRECF